MLNELLIVERGARQAGLDMPQWHPDLKDAGGKSTLIVQLDNKGNVTSVRPVPKGAKPWTLRDGQHNSFPFVQPSEPLWVFDDGDACREKILEKIRNDPRNGLIDLKGKSQFNESAFAGWPSAGFLKRLHAREKQLNRCKMPEVVFVKTTITNFLSAFQPNDDRLQGLLSSVTSKLLENLKQTPQENWIDIAIALMIGQRYKDIWKCNCALLFEAAGFDFSITDQRLISPVANALLAGSDYDDRDQTLGICALTGDQSQLLTGNFPQPKLPGGLGPTYLFAKNKDIRANDRYGRFSAEAMPVGTQVVIRLDGAVRSLTCDNRKNKTWRAIPGEAPNQSDLLLAFVKEDLDATIAGDLTEEDFSRETPTATSQLVNSIAVFEKRTERLIEAIRARASDFRNTPVHLYVLRKLDLANRKVVYAGAPTVGDLYQAATNWAEGERNAPPWLTLPVFMKGDLSPRLMSPPHVSPLGLIAFSKKIFLRNGTRPKGKKKEQVGLPAAEAMRFFLDPLGNRDITARRRSERILGLVLSRRTGLIVGTAHGLRRGFEFVKEYDRHEALRTITLLSVLLNKLTRNKEVYMNETAFKLGQLLAAADVVHAGYCADVRGGNVPPTLLGNQVFGIAQGNPVKALAMLCRRWKPYDGWAKKNANFRMPDRFIDVQGRWKKRSEIDTDTEKAQFDRAAAISVAISQSRKVAEIAVKLTGKLPNDCDDTFRAELLLGYISGLPRGQMQEIDN